MNLTLINDYIDLDNAMPTNLHSKHSSVGIFMLRKTIIVVNEQFIT